MTEVFLQTYGEIQSETAGRAEPTTDLQARRASHRRRGSRAQGRGLQGRERHRRCAGTADFRRRDRQAERATLDRARPHARTQCQARPRHGASMSTPCSAGAAGEVASNVMTELRSQYATLKQEADRLAVRLGPRHPRAAGHRRAARRRARADRHGTAPHRLVDPGRSETGGPARAGTCRAAGAAEGQAGRRQRGDGDAARAGTRGGGQARRLRGLPAARARNRRAADMNTANMSVISTAYPPLEPVGPSRSTIALTGMMLGFVAGVGLEASAARSRACARRWPRPRRRPAAASGAGAIRAAGHRRQAGRRNRPTPQYRSRPDRHVVRNDLSQTRRSPWTPLSEAPEPAADPARHANHNAPAPAREPAAPVSRSPVSGMRPSRPPHPSISSRPIRRITQPVSPRAADPSLRAAADTSAVATAPCALWIMPAAMQQADAGIPVHALAAYPSRRSIQVGEHAAPSDAAFRQCRQPADFAAVVNTAAQAVRLSPQAPIDEIRDSLRELREAVLRYSPRTGRAAVLLTAESTALSSLRHQTALWRDCIFVF